MLAVGKHLPYRIERHGVGWQAIVWIPKRTKRQFNPPLGRAEAEQWASQKRAAWLKQRSGLVDPSAPPSATVHSFGEVTALMLADGRHRLSPHTKSYYLDHLRPACAAFGGVPIAILDPATVREWVREREAISLTQGAKGLGCVQRVLRWAIENALITASPILFMKKSKPAPTYPKDILTAAQVDAILQDAHGWKARGLLLLAAHVGLRRRELRECARDWFDDATDRITVPCDTRYVSKGKRARPLPLSDALIEWLSEWPAGRGWLLDAGRDDVQIRWVFARASRLVGRRVTPHTLRRSYASQLADRGIDVKKIQLALGHTNVATTDRYLRELPGYLDELRAAINPRRGGRRQRFAPGSPPESKR